MIYAILALVGTIALGAHFISAEHSQGATMAQSVSRTIVKTDGQCLAVESADGGMQVLAMTHGERLGVKPNDLVTQLNKQTVTSPEDFFAILRTAQSGELIATIRRNGIIVHTAIDVATYRRIMPPATSETGTVSAVAIAP